MVEQASLNMVVDRLVHVCWNCSWLDERTDWNVVGTIIHDKSTAMFMLLSGKDEITLLRLNSDVTTTMNLLVVSSRVLHVLTCLRTKR